MTCTECGHDNPKDAIYCGSCGKRMAGRILVQETRRDPLSGSGHARRGGAPRLTAGEIFAGRYRIEAAIGEGGMGVVYRAVDTMAGKEIALKLIRPDRLDGEDAVKRLIQEGVTARDIRHPGVVTVYDVGEAGGQPYLSMELVTGVSLRAWNVERLNARDECPMETAAAIVLQVLDALEAAHRAGIVHRDLKPENVMLLERPAKGEVKLKLLDFGLARVSHLSEGSSSGLGTRGYMAPEQITAPGAAQASADLYSLAVMFYELLVGVVPLGHWQPPSAGRADVPQAVDNLIYRALQNNPSARPQSAAEFRQVLQAAIQRRPVFADPPLGGGAFPPEWLRGLFTVKRVLIGGAAAAGLLVMAAGASAVINRLDRPHYRPSPAYSPSYSPSPDWSPSPSPVSLASRAASNPYAWMAGHWHDDFGNTWNVSVSPNGTVSGQASSGPMYGAALNGMIRGDAAVLQVVGNGGVLGQAQGRLENCHINYAALDAYGRQSAAAFHINHTPGANCP